MQRRNFLRLTQLGGIAGLLAPLAAIAKDQPPSATPLAPPACPAQRASPLPPDGAADRAYWTALLMRIAGPILENMAAGTLKKNLPLEKGPGYGLNIEKVTYLEAFGRTISGVAPWLSLPDDKSPESTIRRQWKEYARKGIENAVTPSSPDYLNFRSESQPVVDAAYLCLAFLRAPHALWHPLENEVKTKVITELKQLRSIRPAYNNWLLFAAMIEAFLLFAEQEWEPLRTQIAIKKMQEWYVGDGWYGDGAQFSFDYYDGYVIHPMLTDILQVLTDKGKWDKKDLDQAIKRMQRYAFLQERMIAPDASYPAIGRSMTYRIAAFQPLAQLALHRQLPQDLPPAQVRSALTAVMKKIYEAPGTFDANGWLQLGICGHQPEVADTYTSTGSLYICTNGFLPLGLPPADPFWTNPPQQWTSQKIWSGQPVKKDYHVDY